MNQTGRISQRAARILVIEDEVGQREFLSYNLAAEGWLIIEAADGEEGLLLAHESHPDAIVLDWMLPGRSGLQLCREIKAKRQFRDVPILMLSGRAEGEDRVRGLDTGADDYLPKPYSVAELVSRLRALLRRVRPTAVGEVLIFENIMLDSETFRVTLDGKPIHLGPTEFRLLATLIERPGRVWSREMLLDHVWGRDIYVDTRTVDVHIGRLRKAIGQSEPNFPIRTVRGAGYALG
jgi:two-component system phosphate regulon response regulator PhoB